MTGLLDLPPELRWKIFSLVTVQDSDTIIKHHSLKGFSLDIHNRFPGRWKNLEYCCLPALLHVSRQVRQETANVFFTQNRFYCEVPCSLSKLSRPWWIVFIRDLLVSVRHNSRYASIPLNSDGSPCKIYARFIGGLFRAFESLQRLEIEHYVVIPGWTSPRGIDCYTEMLECTKTGASFELTYYNDFIGYMSDEKTNEIISIISNEGRECQG
ncbi:hypothetical protein EV356DRAFT_291946 [Viridothelium virens]|uniref:2EXR domain-containing protein n=1 Tax=Viridothelium virens TaxID=1048519 RepID=A0A6A6H0V9_VIRVR|nr:hypothetical protein EV356DRAFT_291946 [Viridothelium virens]